MYLPIRIKFESSAKTVYFADISTINVRKDNLVGKYDIFDNKFDLYWY